MMWRAAFISIFVSAPIAAAAATPCKKEMDVYVPAKTALRRGPGLNYPVVAMVESGRCMELAETSNDGEWALVEDSGTLGWVSAEKLDQDEKGGAMKRAPKPEAAAGDPAPEKKPARAPKPRDTAPPADTKPRASRPNVVTPIDELEEAKVETEVEKSGSTQRFAIEVALSVMFPRHGLDSNGNSGIRRYAVKAVGTGLILEARAPAITKLPFGDLDVRLAYSAGFLSGLEWNRDPTQKVAGQEHAGRLIGGVPFDLATAFRLRPEVGYTFQLFSIEPSFPGQQPQFFSNQTHALTFGAAAEYDFSGGFSAYAEAALLVGFENEFPIDLGGAGLAFGWIVGARLHYAISSMLSAVLRWDWTQRSTSFSGPAPVDPTITSARLTDIGQSVSVGVALAL